MLQRGHCTLKKLVQIVAEMAMNFRRSSSGTQGFGFLQHAHVETQPPGPKGQRK
jgi:hypothetical protein